MSRLEEIKRDWEFALKSEPPKDIRYHWKIGLSDNDIRWLIQQAERVEELEEEKHQDPRQGMLEDLHMENERYKQALNESHIVISEAIDALNKGEKVNGLEWTLERLEKALNQSK